MVPRPPSLKPISLEVLEPAEPKCHVFLQKCLGLLFLPSPARNHPEVLLRILPELKEVLLVLHLREFNEEWIGEPMQHHAVLIAPTQSSWSAP